MEAIMTNSSARLLVGAVTGLGMAGVSLSAIRGAAAVETLPLGEPELLPWLSETDGGSYASEVLTAEAVIERYEVLRHG
jgi:hypothetical protein